MGFAVSRRKPPPRQRLGDPLNRSLVATALLLAIASLFACWYGTRAVVDGVVNYEGRETSRQWAVAFAHTLSQAGSQNSDSLTQLYKGGSNPERFKALDDAVFDGQILRYRIYNLKGAVVASSDFLEVGKDATRSKYWGYIERGESHGHVRHFSAPEDNDGVSTVSYAIAPLVWQGKHRGAIEIEADVSVRARQLNRLRYIAFGALTVLLAAVFGILGASIFRTLKKHRSALDELARSERQYRLLFDGSPDSMVIHDQKTILYANDAAATLHGAGSRDALLGMDPMELVPPDKRAAVRENRRKAIARSEIRRSEALGRQRLDGSLVETESMGIPIEWDGRQCLLIQSRDTSVQRAAQREIAFREAQLSAFMENMQAMVFITDTDGRITLVNRRYEEFHGIEGEDVVGKTAHDWAPPEIADRFAEQDRAVLETGAPVSGEAVYPRPDGQTMVIRDDVFPIRDRDGDIIGLGGISTDITDAREREDTITSALAVAERAQAELTAFLNCSPFAMYLKDPDLSVTMVNRPFERFYGRASGQLVGRPISDWMPKQRAEEIEMLDLEVLRTGDVMSVEMEVENAQGEPRIIEFNKYPIVASDGRVVGIGGFNNDVTEQRRQAAEIEETQARLSAYFDHIPMIVVLVDQHSQIMMANNRYTEFFGVEADDVNSDHSRPWLSADLKEIFEEDNRQIFATGDVIERVMEMENAAGERRILHQLKFPIRSGAGPGGAIGVVMADITEQKHREREIEQARDEAQAANRAKSAFLANMSHEIRTPMNGVFGMADLLAQSQLSTDQRRYLDTIRRSGEALLGVINNVLDVSRIEAGEISLDAASFNLDDLVADAAELFAESAAAKGLVIAHYISGNVARTVEADDVRLRQVLINLIGNAVKFTERGEVVVRVVRIGGDDETALVRFEVSDSGIGIPKNQQIKLFDPFQQADGSVTRKFGGTGLGLSIAQHIVGLMGGRIDVDSQPGVGTSFVFSIPLKIADRQMGERPDTGPGLAGKRVLIVDDNDVNREILCQFAEDWGMDPSSAGNARDAQARLRDALHAGRPFDLALLDIQMPDMDGMELAAWIREQEEFNVLRLVALTSFNWDRDSYQAKDAGFSQFATKPVRRSELERILKDVLRRTPSSGIVSAPRARPDQTEQAGRPAPTPEFGVRVLLAEDNPVNQELGREYFTRLGCPVTVAANGTEAVREFRNGEFDLILMDVQMPEMDGIQATTRIRDIEAQRGSERVPIIAATAHAFQEDREKCILAGMDDFLSKPYTQKDVIPVLQRWTQQKRPDAASAESASPAESPAQKSGSLLDPATIEQLRSMDTSGEDRIFRKVAGIFLETTPEQLDKLKAHLETGDFAGIAMIAHGLKTGAANVAALSLSDKFRELEAAGRSEDPDACRAFAEEVFGHYGDVVVALREACETDDALKETA